MPIEFGFNLPQGAPWRDVRAFVAAAERVGIDHVWTNDHLVGVPEAGAPQHEGWTLLAMCAGATHRVRLGHLVLCAGFRHPGLLAKMGATFDHLAEGRLEFGIGAGWLTREFAAYGYPVEPMGTRLARLGDTLQICKRLWAEGRGTYAGAYGVVHDAACVPRPVQRPHPRIVIGGSGERVLLRLVAEHADVWNTNQAGLPHRSRKYEVLRRHCSGIGRDVGEIRVAQQFVLTLGSDDADARRRLRAQREAGGFHNPAEGIWGTSQRVIDHIAHHVACGVDVFNFTNTAGGGHSCEDVERFASEVLPAFR